MKQSRFTGLLFCLAMVFFLTSCGGGGTKEQASTDTTAADNSSTVAVVPEVVNTIITTPENMMIVTHKVADFAKWKMSYDEHDSMRLANGIHNYVIGRGAQDSNTVLVAVKVDDIAKAKAFAKDPSLKKAMQKGGVTGAPSISFVTTTFQDTVKISSNLRSRTMFTVKDWDAWQKAFEEGKSRYETVKARHILIRFVGSRGSRRPISLRLVDSIRRPNSETSSHAKKPTNPAITT